MISLTYKYKMLKFTYIILKSDFQYFLEDNFSINIIRMDFSGLTGHHKIFEF